MEHQLAQELFSAYAENELAPESRMPLEEHLAQCPSCKQEWDFFQRTLGALSALPAVPVPDTFVFDLQKKAKRKMRRERFAHHHYLAIQHFAWISVFLIMLMIAVYLLLLYSAGGH